MQTVAKREHIIKAYLIAIEQRLEFIGYVLEMKELFALQVQLIGREGKKIGTGVLAECRKQPHRLCIIHKLRTGQQSVCHHLVVSIHILDFLFLLQRKDINLQNCLPLIESTFFLNENGFHCSEWFSKELKRVQTKKDVPKFGNVFDISINIKFL
jgi:hypothetical protein